MRVGGTLATLLLLSLLGAIAYLRVWPPLRIVMSPSMEPAIETGDVAVMQAISGVPKVGDVVLVPVPQEVQDRFRYPEEVLHRVIEITADGLVRTKGDNLAEPDPFGVPVSSVRGRMTVVVPGVGRALAFVVSPFGLAWLVAGAILFGVAPFVGSQRDIIYAVEEYGYHLRSHTQILQSMSAASQELSATVIELRRAIAEPRSTAWHSLPPGGPPPPAPADLGPDAVAPELFGIGGPVLYDDELNPLVHPISDGTRDDVR